MASGGTAVRASASAGGTHTAHGSVPPEQLRAPSARMRKSMLDAVGIKYCTFEVPSQVGYNVELRVLRSVGAEGPELIK